MRWLLIFILIIAHGLSAWAKPLSGVRLQVIDNGESGMTIKYHLAAEATNNLDPDFTPLDMTFSDNGAPIPVICRLIEIPAGYKAVIKNVERESRRILSQTVNFDKNPLPISNHMLAGLNLDPPLAVVCGKPEVWRGRTIAPLNIFPVQIISGTESVIENQSLDFEIVFVLDPEAKPFTPVRDMPGNAMSRMIDNILLNHTTNEYVEVQQAHRGRMLILVQDYSDDDRFRRNAVPWIDTLATWKRNMGYRVEIVTVDFRELSPQQIKSEEIFPRYEDQNDPLTYVLLIGGAEPEGQVFFPTLNRNQGEDGDHFYTVLGENEYFADIALGRMEVVGFDQLRGAVLRTINYERDPFVEDDGDWLERALFTAETNAAQGGSFVPSMIHLGRWVVDKLEQFGYFPVDTLWKAEEDDNINPDVKDILEAGVGITVCRGWLEGSYDLDIGPPDNGRKNPFILAVTCYSYDTQLGFFQTVDNRGNDGPIASISMKGLSNTTPNNSLLGGSVRGLVHFGLHQTGIIHNFGKYQMWSDKRYDLSDQVLNNVAVFRLMGDPTTQIFTRRPIPLEAEFPEAISVGATGLSIQVVSDDAAVPDAWVSIYQTDGIHLVCQPGEDGWARFTFPQAILSEGDIGVTITRYNALPVIGSIEVVADGERIDLTEIQFDPDDGVFGNGDVVTTTLTFTNNGDNGQSELTINLSTDDLFVNIAEDQFQIDRLPAGEDILIEFDLEIARASQSGRTVRIQADLSSVDAAWESAFSFESSGHKLTKDGAAFADNDFRSGNVATFRPQLRNSGDLPTPEINAVLISLSPYVTVITDEATYSTIGEDGGAQIPRSPFRVEAESLSVNGSIARFRMILTAADEDDAFRDTIAFTEVIGNSDITDPFGPDDYGYLIFDSGDTDWAKAPVYDWKEINPNKNNGIIVGTELELEDYRVDLDSTIAVELPFPFRFYGEVFDTIAVNSNGWIAFGADRTQYLDFRNQQIPGIQGPDAQIAVFWQDLINYLANDNAGVYYFYDQEAETFTIEWSDMRVYQYDGESVEVQIILYNPAVYPTTTGDGEIKLQYKTAPRVEGDHTDNKYCTVGIKNLDGTGGLEYTYWDQYPAANRPLEAEMALFITSDRFPTFGSIEGVITREEDPEAELEGVVVRTLRSGEESVTDNNGNFAFESILTGREQLRLTKSGFNTLVLTVDVAEDSTSRVEGRMTHPQIIAPNEPIVRGLHTGNFGVTFNYSIENQGNGPLEFDFSRRYADSSSTEYAETWNANLSELAENDNWLFGCQFVENQIFVTGAADIRNIEDERIYVYERNDNEATLVRSFLQPNQSNDGFYDLAYDGHKLFGGEKRQINDSTSALVIVEFDLNGNNVRPIFLDVDPDVLVSPYALAYNPRDSTLITTRREKDIYVFNMEGELVNQVDLFVPGEVLDVQGLAWNDDDDDDMPLYIIDYGVENGGMRLTKANLETGETMVLSDFMGEEDDRTTGLTIGYQWDEATLSLASIAGGEGRANNDFIRVYEIGPDSHYFKINPAHGTIESGQSLNIRMEMRSTDLDEGEYSHVLAISHDADDEEIFVLSTLIVNDTLRAINNDNVMPQEFKLNQAYPNPFNNMTRINFSLTTEEHTELKIFDIRGRMVAELISEKLQAGAHSVLFRPEVQASGIYFYRLKSGSESAVRRMVYLK